MNTPAELLYSEMHTWVREEGNGVVTVGLTDYAQDQLGEMVAVVLPEEGDEVHASDEVVNLESAKTTSDVYSPLSGTIIAINEDLQEAPSFVNSDPYGDGWFFQLKLSDIEELDELLDAETYQEELEEE